MDYIVEYKGTQFIVEYRILTVKGHGYSVGYVVVWKYFGKSIKEVVSFEFVTKVEYICCAGTIEKMDYVKLRESISQKIGQDFCCFVFRNVLRSLTKLLFVNTGV